MVKIPPYLKKGDTIGLVCPAGFMLAEKVQSCISTLEEWGYKVKLGNTIGGNSENYFSGNDAERLADLQQMLDSEDVKAILCARGGYGVGRIIDQISFKKFKKNPKWIIGFSDITVLHNHIHSNFNIATLHAPMAAAFNGEEYKNDFVRSLKKALEGKKLRYESEIHPFNRKGDTIGTLVGGNLSLIAHLIGTPSDIETNGKILFLEDVGEYLYNIDRMLYQLKRSGKLDKLAGLVIGGFTDSKDTERPYGQKAEEIIRDIVAEYAYPVCYGFPVSHEKYNYALRVGVGYRLKVTKNHVILEE